MNSKVLTVIVTYNGIKWLDRGLHSLRTSSILTDVILIDNGSTDGTQDYIKSEFPEVRLHEAGVNLGFGRANNIGLTLALEKGYDYVYLLNQDAWVFQDTFARLIEAMESKPDYGILSPMQLTAEKDKMDPRFMRWCPDVAWQQWLASNSESAVQQVDSCVHPVEFVMAAHWMISRDCLKKVGGFSPAFVHYGEDDNYIHRAIYHGFRCGILSSAGAVHDREMRPMTKDASMRLKCVASIVKISNPLNNFFLRCLIQPLELLAISLRYRSFKVFKNIFTLISSYSQLRVFRSRSLSEGAFIETNF